MRKHVGKLLRATVRALDVRSKYRDRQPFVAQRRLVSNDDAVIADVGAQIGQTVALYRALFPRATIHSFEPFPESFAALSRALAPDPRAHAHNVALGASVGRGTLTMNRLDATNSLLPSDERAASYWGAGLLDTTGTVDVPVMTLDAFCAEKSIAHLDILKIDVQGAEFDVLTGAASLLQRQAIDVIYMEMILAPTYVGQHDLYDYLGLARAYGYVLYDFLNPVRVRGRLLQTDNLLVAEPFLTAYERAAARGH